MNQLLENDKWYWIGLTDSAVEGQFVWQHSLQPLEWSNWATWQPDNFNGNEDCVCTGSPYNLEWDDAYCIAKNSIGYKIYALCQYSPEHTETTSAMTTTESTSITPTETTTATTPNTTSPIQGFQNKLS